MPIRLAVGCLVAAACAAPSSAPSTAAAAAGQAARGLALLVGIDDYAPPEFGVVPRLAGAQNDVQRVQHLLVERLGFAADDVVLLLGADATHAAIVSTFHRHLIQQATPGTRVVFWFSGHGSRTPDLSGRESSKTGDPGDGAYDNTLLAYDSRAVDADGAYDVVDDELHSLLRALVQRTDQALLVTDCCHASGAVRGHTPPAGRFAAPGRRGVAPAALAAFWPPDVPLLDDDAPEPEGPFPYVHVAAAGEHQAAGELRVDGRSFGTLTWFLTAALDELQPGTSWRQLCEQVRARVAGAGSRPDQTVSWAGEVDRPVFGADVLPPPRGFRADRRGDGLCIEAGRVHGLGEGATFTVLDAVTGAACGEAKLVTLAAAWCVAAWIGPPPAAPGTALRAVPHPQSLRSAPLRVAFGADVPAVDLADFPWAVAAAEADADYRLQQGDGGLVLTDAAGAPLRPLPAGLDDLRTALFREYTFRSLWESVASRGDLPLGLELVPPDDATRALAAQRGLPLAVLGPTAAGASAQVAAAPLTDSGGGSLVTLRVHNRSELDLRVTVLSLSEDRAVHVVWPRRNEWDRVLRSGESQTLPVLVGPSPDWRLSRPMVDRYLAIATLEPADFLPFTSAAPIWSPQRGGRPVPGFLQGLLAAGPVRGGGPPADDRHGLASCDLLLVPADPAPPAALPRRIR